MQMIGNRHSISFFLVVSAPFALLVAVVAQAGQLVEVHPRVVEVFTTTESPVTGAPVVNRLVVQGKTEFQVYELDGIQSIEAKLSEGLTADAEQSKRVVLQRFQLLREENHAQIQSTAMGLAKAMQYGVDRYPAIVFDGQAVIYGVTDVQTALAHYRTWRREDKR
ncbi:MAG: TIGR03757 family integrating conjugative element protein [Candidatus Thiodiazotropha sp. (ex Ctena orbiculata)]|nr:TIGR03757 family integrating conjugative element protein [Candidatus Thiodiazotropha taylori]